MGPDGGGGCSVTEDPIRAALGEGETPGPAPDLDPSNFAKLNSLLDKTMAYSQFIQNSLPDAGTRLAATTGDQGKGKSKAPQEREDLVNPTLLEGGGALRDYQRVGVTWLVSLFKNGVNGILADEMGLGKTIITIGFLAHLWEKKLCGPFLIVAPLSTLANWKAELSKWCPFMPALLYHGSKDERQEMQRQFQRQRQKAKDTKDTRSLGVVITSFEMAMRDIKFLCGCAWKYLVVDEAHRLKNFDCRLIRELRKVDAANRLLITGTPLQNNLSELWSLLNFILPDIFDDLNSFRSWFDFDDVDDADKARHILHSEQQNQVISKLHNILRPFMLRRLKNDVGLDLPRKTEVVVYCELTPRQAEWYEAIRTKSLEALVQAEGRAEGARATSIRNVVMQLRKLCNHPFLFEEFDPLASRTVTEYVAREAMEEYDIGDSTPYRQKRKWTDVVTKEVRNLDATNPKDRKKYRSALIGDCGKLQLLHAMLPALKAAGHKVLLFSQMTRLLDILEEYLELEGHSFCRIDGAVGQKERQARIVAFNTDPSVFLFLLSTRAGGLGINLCAADTVIIYDSDWNPQVDLQAQDRCHRIGQTKPVCVYRLVTANTVESYLLRRATRKLQLEHLVIEAGQFGSRQRKAAALEASDLEEILNLRGSDLAVGKDVAITPQHLEKILDRAHVMALLCATPGPPPAPSPAAASPDTATTPMEPNTPAAGFEVLEEVAAVF